MSKFKGLTDDQLLEALKKFEGLSDTEKESSKIGKGMYKKAYTLPGHDDFVLKTGAGLPRDYIDSKLLQKAGVPVEQPALIARPEGDHVQIQRKLKTIPKGSGYDLEKVMSKAYDQAGGDSKKAKELYKELKKIEMEKINKLPENIADKELMNAIDSKEIYIDDYHRGNIGLDEKGKGKLFDVANFDYYDKDDVYQTLSDAEKVESDKLYKKNIGLGKTRENFGNYIDKLTKTKILRQIAGPLAGIGVGIASGDASAAIPLLGDSEGLGMSPDDENKMIAEEKAKMNYNKSQARRDALKAIKGSNR